MASYAITVRGDQAGFDVEIVARDGVRETMVGFKTQADAEAWIVRDAQFEQDSRSRRVSRAVVLQLSRRYAVPLSRAPRAKASSMLKRLDPSLLRP